MLLIPCGTGAPAQGAQGFGRIFKPHEGVFAQYPTISFESFRMKSKQRIRTVTFGAARLILYIPVTLGSEDPHVPSVYEIDGPLTKR